MALWFFSLKAEEEEEDENLECLQKQQLASDTATTRFKEAK